MKLGKLGVWDIIEVKTAAQTAALAGHIEQHRDAGADHVCIQDIDPTNPANAMGISNIDERLLETMARALA